MNETRNVECGNSVMEGGALSPPNGVFVEGGALSPPNGVFVEGGALSPPKTVPTERNPPARKEIK